jgi:integrase
MSKIINNLQSQLKMLQEVQNQVNECLNKLNKSNALTSEAKQIMIKEFGNYFEIKLDEAKLLTIDETKIAFKNAGVLDSTATSYLSSYQRIINNCFENKLPTVAELEDSTKIINYLNTLNLSVSKTILNGYINCLKIMNINTSQFDTEFKALAKKADDARAYAAPTEKQEENQLTMAQVEQKRDELKIDNKKLREYALLCLYTYIPPLRAQDYRTSLLFEDSSKEDTIDINYLCLKSKRLVICNYKTKTTHGTRIIDVPDEVINVLTEYKNKYKAKYVVSGKDGNQMSQTAFVNFMQRIFDGKKVSTNMLRKFFISEKIENEKMNGLERKKQAHIMGHTLGTQQLNYTTFSKICKK